MYKVTTLAYPRSGSTLVQYLLRNALPTVFTNKLHGHDMIRYNISAYTNETLIVLIRNYKECIMSHLSRHGNEHKPERIEKAFMHYAKVLEVYLRSTGPKMHIYYEDLIQLPELCVERMGDFLQVDVDHIIRKMDYHLAQSKMSYIRNLGGCQTDGTQITYFTPLTKEYDFDWDQRMRDTALSLYDEYLTRYGETNE